MFTSFFVGMKLNRKIYGKLGADQVPCQNCMKSITGFKFI